MAITPLHPESVTSRPDLEAVENSIADLDTCRVLSTAAERSLSHVREWLKFFPVTNPGFANARDMMVAEMNDLETLIVESSCRSKGVRERLIGFVEAENAHRTGGDE